ncbi:sulfite exporter TauE/SafE family protein [Striga asiatica]|uniref:Sulfite exporter TauE/SafE family protein n=1 Tax=Striga asiatica TaxID=4170 RepID=A0A5A7Q3F3_STRAF|nr:sulfite exporter TauE/SafE family protein [Striga asiatica]
MAGNLERWKAFGPFFTVVGSFVLASIFVSADRSLKQKSLSRNATGISVPDSDSDFLSAFVNFIWQAEKSGYQHVWPDLEFNWQIVIGSIIGFFGAAFGSVGGVGGGGIFVPMLTLIVGFDPKSATAISKCMIMGAAVSTVYYNLRLRHPTIEMPIIDYDLAVLIQPMLMLGISIGVTFNVIFADWMVTVLLIFLFIVTSTKAFFKGVETWKKETILKKEAAKQVEANGKDEAEYKLLPGGPSNNTDGKGLEEQTVAIIENVCWKEFGLLAFVWFAFLALQIIKNYLPTCSAIYWVVNLLQVSSATATFAMMFSSSMSVVEYYLLKRFPVPYALYFVAVATVAAFIGQHVVRRMIIVMGRASIIIFILSFTIFVSAISLGGVGISNMIGKIQRHEYMGFENLCKSGSCLHSIVFQTGPGIDPGRSPGYPVTGSIVGSIAEPDN